MKKLRFNKALAAALIVAVTSIGLLSCHKKKKDSTDTSSAAGTTTVSGEITSDTHWTSSDHILLKGYVYVTSGHTLTIDAGTIIKGDKNTKGTLIIEMGAKIQAVGTPSSPIIFTSNQPAGARTYGDWGGVVICGQAPNNWIAAPKTDGTVGTVATGFGQVEGGPRSLYGGSTTADNSGTLKYARIEFGGVAFSPNNEINGLTLCSVGSGTTIDHIQVSYSGDDAFEWFGGTVACKNLVAYKAWDDDFDTDNGFSGSVQFGMIYRDPNAADQSGSHTFESDSRNESSTAGLAALPLTAATFQNITAVGPLSNASYTGYNSNFVCGQIVRRASSLSVYNSLIIGYPLGLIIDEDPSFSSTYSNITAGTLNFANNAVIQTPSVASVIVARKNDPHSAPNSILTTLQDSSAWTTAGFTSPKTWFVASNNYYGATEGLTSRLNYAFNNSGTPNFQPASTSYIIQNQTALPGVGVAPSNLTTAQYAAFAASQYSYGKYPFNPALAINTDTTAQFSHYNAPQWKANQTVAGHTNYLGAFISTDDWVASWTNFNPVNANYGAEY